MLSSLVQQSLVTLSPDAAAQFSAGWLYGIEDLDKRDYILGCFRHNQQLNATLDRAMADYSQGK